MKPPLGNLAPLLFLLAAGVVAAAQESNAPAALNAPVAPPPATAAETTPALPATAFQIIIQRNMFDPNRRPYSPNTRISRVPVVQEFSFRGALDKVGKGRVAEFTGNAFPNGSAEFCANEIINPYGYKITAIAPSLHEVTLQDVKTTNNPVTLSEEGGLRQVDGGPWSAFFVPATYPAAIARMEVPSINPSFDAASQFGGRQDFQPDDNTSGNRDNADPFGSGNGNGRPNRRQRGGNRNGNNAGAFNMTITPAAPTAPVDPSVLERLRQRRAQENQ